ncbi:hypothetical protein [Streptomyces sp. NPDC048577]|uniref:hypothetical protein n=1 Tax=Streptomyces sp. NPDC048577 TaxID=3157209 RepID=UPI00344217D8
MRTRIRHGVAAVLAVSSLALTAACGGSGDSDAKGGDEKSAGTPAASAKATESAPAAAPLTEAQMKAGALALTDLPSGWKASTSESDGTVYKADKPECAPLATLLADEIAGATTGASVDYETAGTESLIGQQVATFPGTGAADLVKSVGTAVDACAGFGAEMQGMKMDVTLQKLTAPQGAEEAHAFRLKMKIKDVGITVESNMLVASQGTGLTRFSHTPANASGHKDFDGLAKLAVEKFAKGAQS